MIEGPAGWYVEPHDARSERYWDGQVWTDLTRDRRDMILPVEHNKFQLAKQARKSNPAFWCLAALYMFLPLALILALFLSTTTCDEFYCGSESSTAGP